MLTAKLADAGKPELANSHIDLLHPECSTIWQGEDFKGCVLFVDYSTIKQQAANSRQQRFPDYQASST